MSRITSSQRKKVARSLADTYTVYNSGPISGVARVKSLAFSPHPRCWSIFAETVSRKLSEAPYKVCDVEITATVSRQWLGGPGFNGLLPFNLSGYGNNYRLLAGFKNLDPPPGIRHLALVSFAESPPTSSSNLRLTPRWGFRFSAQAFESVCGISTSPPVNMSRAIAAAHQEFREFIASKVASRLNPRLNFHHV
jgi:hypothetical protein